MKVTVEIISRQVAEPDSETDGWLHEIGGTEFKTLAMAINHARDIDEAKRKAGE